MDDRRRVEGGRREWWVWVWPQVLDFVIVLLFFCFFVFHQPRLKAQTSLSSLGFSVFS